MVFTPDSIPPGTLPCLEQMTGVVWTPLFRHNCSFPPEIFREVMLNLIRNPNINSNHLFRADISLDAPYASDFSNEVEPLARITQFKDFELNTIMVRTMIPRNMVVDQPLDQTCLIYKQVRESGDVLSLVVYLPHISEAAESPFYHPAVHGIGFLHRYSPKLAASSVSIHYSFFDSEPRSEKLERTAQHLLAVLYKHGQGTAAGYVKRVQHDVILPQATVQNTYARLKAKYSRKLIQAWVETTDPGKHVFEDLGIAAFLIELWTEMYKGKKHPGFVDIGCGNGLLVHILHEEGYTGWGFDARRRKSWATYSEKTQESLKELVLIPSIIRTQKALSMRLASNITSEIDHSDTSYETVENHKGTETLSSPQNSTIDIEQIGIHDGLFPDGTFIVSNHADELTPWTPILATLSKSPFMMIPCCSHALSGARFRAPPPKGSSLPCSAYACLVIWVSKLASECGWGIEKEMLRIPSTRNTALIGRLRTKPFEEIDAEAIVVNNGGAVGWEANALKLVKGATRGH